MIVSLQRECRTGELRVLILPQDISPLCEICGLHVETGVRAVRNVAIHPLSGVGALFQHEF